ncbi:short-chain dehydrogenase [Mycolicibacterium duvalii]|uniref:Short-chain dehydrogenase n=1 Tax=Mycolicibacterium duvalii TaxID=39688 RepID=A0A7I7JXZ4_9MYCO|nr:SDR family NAD(P)-dependent oxidoreductase [Mycolicibacterium duvalii]MCV7369379.1 SDR family NAD(P)-dependent oxidoreductase [Mycolicibacterium duvalii]PEG40569.1 short-chain dehydrogenase [Mycolicibacterium duvalii]BBX16099.1 short-chain dehydrogenase [Mycolicibacterium duvalii]
MNRIDLAGRVVLVTGGGRGLGEAYCRELAHRGAAVVVHDNGSGIGGRGHDPAPAQDVAAAIVDDGGRAVACVSDSSTDAGGREAIMLALREYGRLDAVVANAGIIHDDSFEDWPTDRFEALLRHHLMAAFHVVRPAFAVMKDTGYGRIVFVSSAAGVFGQPRLAGYAAAKTGMLGLMNVVALEGAEFGITANAIMPMAATRMARALMADAADTADGREFLDSLRVDQVAPVVAYLASESCSRTQLVLSAFRGRVAALQIGVTRGWISETGMVSAEDVASHLDEITDTHDLLVPGSIFDEMASLS